MASTKHLKRNRGGRSVKSVASTEFTKIVLTAALDLMLTTNAITSRRNNPPIPQLRDKLKPAYEQLAKYLPTLFDRIEGEVRPEALSSLTVDMHPALGTYSIRVNYKQPDGRIQPFIIHTSAQDGRNTYLRMSGYMETDDAFGLMESI